MVIVVIFIIANAIDYIVPSFNYLNFQAMKEEYSKRKIWNSNTTKVDITKQLVNITIIATNKLKAKSMAAKFKQMHYIDYFEE